LIHQFDQRNYNFIRGLYFEVEWKNVLFTWRKPEYETKENKIVIAKYLTQGPLALEPRKAIDVGTDLAKTLDIPILYFDLDKSFIRKDAAFELEKYTSSDARIPKDDYRH
jgi:hypothetical protein